MEIIMKELHLICNAHLDPVWQWDWNEGATAALATFYSAVDIAEEYDYIFCHNEALLYEYVEKYDPKLFARIKELVEAGKWHIMGGWYVQPDCNIPSGEGFIRQIEAGLKYFKEKFGKRPTVAVNFDSFGHTQGLVQILNKCGYQGYIFCRPMDWIFDLPAMHFDWKGFDGSSVHAARFQDDTIYCSELGHAVRDIKRKMRPWMEEDVAFALWGIGNHGGGASRRDLADIKDFIEEEKANGVQVFHSTPEQFFAAATPKVEYTEALQPCFVKCYTSIARLKRRYAETENKLLMTEKICALASVETGYKYDVAVFDEAQKNMAMVQFHDVLSGTCIIEGEKSSMQKLDHALELLDGEFAKAFMALCGDYKRAVPMEYPIFVYNPSQSAEEVIFNADFFMLNCIVSDNEGYEFTVKRNGVEVPFQRVKEMSRINMDRSIRLAIKSELNPLSMTRFDISFRIGKKWTLDRTPVADFETKSGAKARFDTELGALSSFVAGGKEYLAGAAFRPVVYDDNEDPWGWHMKTVGKNYKYAEPKLPLRTIENGELLTETESYYDTGRSDVRVSYKLYRDFDFIDLAVNAFWNDPGKGLKLEIPLAEIGKFIGQTAFGTQTYTENLEECSQRFVGVEMGDKVLAILKDGTYGCSIENGKLYINLLNGSVYCAHPVGELPIIDPEIYNKYIEPGRHEFRLRLMVCDREQLEKEAQKFVERPYALNFYPHGEGKIHETAPVTVSDDAVTLSCLRKTAENTFMVRLFNNTDGEKKCKVAVFGENIDLTFGKYEVKTLLHRNGKLFEHDSMLDL
ncbi:MAG: hypothetical protein IJY39_05405 [Clostridia bacterium]|nr:hypothetical protein [Clostridia bacterium]